MFGSGAYGSAAYGTPGTSAPSYFVSPLRPVHFGVLDLWFTVQPLRPVHFGQPFILGAQSLRPVHFGIPTFNIFFRVSTLRSINFGGATVPSIQTQTGHAFRPVHFGHITALIFLPR